VSAPDLPDVPAKFLVYPNHNVIALLPTADAAAAAIADLSAAGYDEAFVLVGPEGAEQLDLDGHHHGLRGRVYRALGHIGDEHEELVRAAEHLRSGGVALRVHSTEHRARDTARILQDHGAVHAAYFGTFTFESLGG